VKKALFLATGLLALAALPAAASDWSDTAIGLRYGTTLHDPTIAKEETKTVLALTHASSYAYGSNFFNLDMLRSNMTDPANAGGDGAQETYITYRHHLALGKTLTGKPLNTGIIKDVAFTAGFEWNSKNTQFAPGKWAVVAGPTVQFKLPKGFFDLGLLYYKERNHNSFGNTPAGNPKSADFDGTYMVAAAWGVPIALGPVTSTFKGFANYQGAKGKDAAGVDTKPETLSRFSWMFDIGALVSSRKGALLIGPGFEYWKNKFGNPDPIPTSNPAITKPNDTTKTPTIQLEWHF
jgi:hypothetical protein